MQEPSKEIAGRPAIVPSLLGARFVPAAVMFTAHAAQEMMFKTPEANGAFYFATDVAGLGAVTFFFLLSGFVLTWSAKPSDNALSFWRRRFFRIVPTYVVAFALAYTLVSWGGNPRMGPIKIESNMAFYNLLLLQSWFPDLRVLNMVNPPTWSLSAEMLFYVALPFLLPLVRRIRPDRLWGWFIGVSVVILAMPMIGKTFPGQPVPGVGVSQMELWFTYFFPPVRMLEFILGILLARIVMTGRKLPLGVGTSVTLAIGVGALTPLLPVQYKFAAALSIPLGLVIAALAAADVKQGGKQSWLASPGMLGLSQLTYAFFLVHPIVLMHGHQWLGKLGFGMAYSKPVALAVILLILAVSLLLSWALFTFVENPIYRTFAIGTAYREAQRRPRTDEPVAVTVGPVAAVEAESVAGSPAGEPTRRLPASH